MNILPSGIVYFANRHLDSKVEYFTFHLLHSTARYYYTVENYKKYTQESKRKPERSMGTRWK